jgi:uncharacterized protein
VIPSEEEALALHRKYGSNDIIIRHCLRVAEVANLLAEGFRRAGKALDIDAVAAGAVLHDIGRNRTQTVRHGLEGAKLLREEGVDDKVAEIVKRHVGAGISAEEAKKLGFPDDDYVPRSLEELTVSFADKLVGSDKVRPFSEEVERFVRKGHDVGRLLAMKKRLQKELGEDPERFVLDNIKESH